MVRALVGSGNSDYLRESVERLEHVVNPIGTIRNDARGAYVMIERDVAEVAPK